MASSRERGVLALIGGACALLLAACSVGKGEGHITGTVSVPECGVEGDYTLEPDFFVADAIDAGTEIRIQRGSDWEVYSDGMILFVHDATTVQTAWKGREITLGAHDGSTPEIDVTFYLNETCRVRARRDDTPVALRATGGTITFRSIYAPSGDESEVETDALLTAVTFEDDTSASPRSATLEGDFNFLYNRGRPAQRFP